MKKYIPLIFISCSILAACGGGEETTTTTSTTTDESNSLTFTQTAESVRNDPTAWSDEATILAKTDQEEVVYLEQIGTILTNYVNITKESGYPTGLNYEVTNKLLGQNSKLIALIDTDHPKINDDGEIVDSWGSPYYFHSETSSDITIQSAGPDLVQYTDDDITYEELNSLAAVIESSSVTDLVSTDASGTVSVNSSSSLQAEKSEPTPSTFDGYATGEFLAQ